MLLRKVTRTVPSNHDTMFDRDGKTLAYLMVFADASQVAVPAHRKQAFAAL